jgi:hypothetical protein
MAATMEINLYFCNVKNVVRHDVAAKGSVFCASENSKRFNRNDGGRSNALKGFALHSLTHRIAVFYV